MHDISEEMITAVECEIHEEVINDVNTFNNNAIENINLVMSANTKINVLIGNSLIVRIMRPIKSDLEKKFKKKW